MAENKVFYIYDPWVLTWIQKLLRYENKDWEESIRIRWTYGKKRPWTKEALENMQHQIELGKEWEDEENNCHYITEEEFNERFKEFEKFWEEDETFYIVDPGVDGFRHMIKYEIIWWEEEIIYYDQNWKEKSCSLEEKLKELEVMTASEIFWDRWDCFEVNEESAKETLGKWRTGK